VPFQVLIPGSSLVSLLESKSGFEIATQTCGHRKTTIFTSLVYIWQGRGSFYWYCLILRARNLRHGVILPFASQDAFWSHRLAVGNQRQKSVIIISLVGKTHREIAVALWIWSIPTSGRVHMYPQANTGSLIVISSIITLMGIVHILLLYSIVHCLMLFCFCRSPGESLQEDWMIRACNKELRRGRRLLLWEHGWRQSISSGLCLMASLLLVVNDECFAPHGTQPVPSFGNSRLDIQLIHRREAAGQTKVYKGRKKLAPKISWYDGLRRKLLSEYIV
jgi:hypothetical protein